MDLQERILNKLDEIDNKLDSHVERIVKVEEKQASISGQIKWAFSLILAGITATIGAVIDYFKGQ